MLHWFSENARDLPWRRTHDPYAVWVSEIMLQQTQVKTVIPYWERWMRELPTLQHLADAPSDKIHKLWEGLGYYTRVRNMQNAAQIIVEKSKGVFPKKYEEVLNLSGIGPYTAGAICSIAFNQATPILDGNVIRVLTRVYGIAENPREKETNAKLWRLAKDLVFQAKEDGRPSVPPFFHPLSAAPDSSNCSFFNQSLMELGALICTPRQPKCLLCPIKKGCVAQVENRTEQLPNLGKRVSATSRRFAAFVVERNGKFLVRQRPDGIVNARLWEFPNVELALREINLTQAAKPFRLPKNIEPLCQIKHSITRYRITLEAFRAELPEETKNMPGSWQTLEQLTALAFSSAHRKILTVLESQPGLTSYLKNIKVS